jgi:outer membrane protein TolC
LDVSEADGRVHTIEASIPPLQAQLDELTDALAILFAQVPESFGSGGLHIHAAMPDPPPLSPSLPSEVIAQRPDIRRAEPEYAQPSANVDDRRTVLEAQERYQRGQENLLPALEAQQLLYATDDALVVSSLSRRLVDISRFKALGGNWENVALQKVAAARRATN